MHFNRKAFDLGDLGGPGRPGNPSKRWGGTGQSPQSFCRVSRPAWAAQQNARFSVCICHPHRQCHLQCAGLQLQGRRGFVTEAFSGGPREALLVFVGLGRSAWFPSLGHLWRSSTESSLKRCSSGACRRHRRRGLLPRSLMGQRPRSAVQLHDPAPGPRSRLVVVSPSAGFSAEGHGKVLSAESFADGPHDREFGGAGPIVGG